MKGIFSLFLTLRFFSLAGLAVAFFIFGFFLAPFFTAALIFLFVLLFLLAADVFLLCRTSGVSARRTLAEKLSNGEQNPVELCVANEYPFAIRAEIIDELPFQFQNRDFLIRMKLAAGETALSYSVRPVERGEYSFGSLHVYASSPLGMAQRRYSFAADMAVPVYPSIIQMRKYDLFAISNRLAQVGVKKIRRSGASMEFDQIGNYVTGDDVRKINWKATARKNDLMVNRYKDERSQNLYCVIDTSRVMKMPFRGMTLLDYAINSSLVISNIAIRREDRAGVVSFGNGPETILPADRRYSQIHKILELLYNIRTDFLESDYERLCAVLSGKIARRSLLLLFTNFETLSSLRRNLKYLSMIAKKHFLVVIFFENTELARLLSERPATTEQVYIKTIAEKFSFEKKQIVKELERHGIHAICTSPESLTIRAINKYIELKARGLL